MLVPYQAQFQYFNYPIFVVGYPDERYGHNLTTCSSAYSLGDMYCFGLSAATNAAHQLQQARVAAINFLDAKHRDMFTFTGSHPGQNKLQDPRFAHRLIADVPVLEAAFASLILVIDRVDSYHGYVNFTSHITQRLVQDSALDQGRWVLDQAAPVGYFGDQSQQRFCTPKPLTD